MSQYKALVDKINEISDLEKSAAVLSWDREVMMPAAGNDARTQQLATLRRIIHAMFISDETGELIEAADSEVMDLPYDSNEASLIRYLKKSYADSRKLPVEFVAKMSEITGQALPVWKEARANNDFLSFQPWLDQVIELGQ